MSKIMKVLFLLVLIFLTTSVYSNNNQNQTSQSPGKIMINITVNSKSYKADIIDNDSSNTFLSMLPLSLKMEDLNNNEKFFYFQEKLPTNSQSIGNIRAGDIMLYGEDCLVLFYKSFTTTYRYTRIGRIIDTNGLMDALGLGTVTVSFRRN